MIQVFMGHPSAFGLIDHQNGGIFVNSDLVNVWQWPSGLIAEKGLY